MAIIFFIVNSPMLNGLDKNFLFLGGIVRNTVLYVNEIIAQNAVWDFGYPIP